VKDPLSALIALRLSKIQEIRNTMSEKITPARGLSSEYGFVDRLKYRQ
jgi:hypothetical protein